MSKNLNRRIHPIAEAYGLSPKKLHKHSRILAIKPYSPRNEEASVLSDRGFNYYVCMERKLIVYDVETHSSICTRSDKLVKLGSCSDFKSIVHDKTTHSLV